MGKELFLFGINDFMPACNAHEFFIYSRPSRVFYNAGIEYVQKLITRQIAHGY